MTYCCVSTQMTWISKSCCPIVGPLRIRTRFSTTGWTNLVLKPFAPALVGRTAEPATSNAWSVQH